MRAKERSTAPSSGVAAPESPVPAPRAVTERPADRAACTTATTSSRSAGHTTYAGLPAGTPSASSAHRSATDGSSPAITCSAPTASASAWNIPVS